MMDNNGWTTVMMKHGIINIDIPLLVALNTSLANRSVLAVIALLFVCFSRPLVA